MHQILGLRPYFNEKKQQWDKTDNTFFKRNWRFKSLSDLFLNLDEHLKQIPKKDRVNLYYTVAFCTDGKREFRELNNLVFDVDAIGEDTVSKHTPESLVALYSPIVCEAIGVKENETAVVFSGNGLHFIVQLNAPIVDPLFFDKERRHYNAYIAKIDTALARANLPGKGDPSVFDPRRIMRLPGTFNEKEGRPRRLAVLVRKELVEVPFDLARGSGLPTVEAKDQVNAQGLKKYPKPDTESIIAGCDFLKWCKENPNDVNEAQWYGMLSVVPRLPPNGRDLAHEFSSGHRGYTHGECEQKIDQALSASGPRTCANINGLWGKCGGCKHFDKVASPIMIQGAGYIKTKDNGFHDIVLDKNGNPRPGKPNYEDLRRFFQTEHPYCVLGTSGICLTWNGTHWEDYADIYLRNYAQQKFNPIADERMRSEFKNLVCCTNIKAPEWFTDTTSRKTNFKNGVLDLDSMKLIPHSMDFGFRYTLDYDYDPEAKAPAFEAFMLSIMDGRTDLVNVLLEFFGYAFSNDECWAEKALIMTGDGANGKSTLMHVLKALSGEANCSKLTLKDLHVEAARKMLEGKLFNIAEETPTAAMTESSLFKNLVSGGDTTVKVLYKQPYTIANKTKLMFACNELPRTRDVTRGYFRKLLICPFDKRFEGAAKDPFIKAKLMTELPGIFNLVIEGYRRLKKQLEFSASTAVEKAIEEYKDDLDNVKTWLGDCATLLEMPKTGPHDVAVPLSKLYSSYSMYAESRGDRPEPQTTFARRLRHLVPDYEKRKDRRNISGKREIVFQGIKYHDGSQY